MNTKATVTRQTYHITIHNYNVPGNLSFRSSGRHVSGVIGRRYLKCPFCSSRLIDVVGASKARFVLNADITAKDNDFIEKCDICKKEVGVRIIR